MWNVGKWCFWRSIYQITLFSLYLYQLIKWWREFEKEFGWLISAWIQKYINYISKCFIPINGALWYTKVVSLIIEHPVLRFFHVGAVLVSKTVKDFFSSLRKTYEAPESGKDVPNHNYNFQKFMHQILYVWLNPC